MNKLITKIVGATLGVTMAVGVGVAVANNNKEASPAYATNRSFALYSGALTEGDYIIYYDGVAMENTVSSSRLGYVDVTPVDNSITTTNAGIIWHIAASGNYWTIYNDDAEMYAASTGAKNKAQLLADGTDDKSLWSVSGESTYEFVNKQNHASSVNENLRYNSGYGFACYSTSTGDALSLYKESNTPTISFSNPTTTVNVGDSVTNIATGTNLGDNTITYSSSDNTTAAVDAFTGEVTGIKKGSATITASVTVSTVREEPFTASYNIEVTQVVFRTYIKITSTDDLIGGKYLIVFEDSSAETPAPFTFDGSLETLDASSNTQSITIANTKSKVAEDYVFTLAASNNKWTVKSASGNYIGVSSYKNGLVQSSSTPYENNISFDSNGNALISMTFTGGTMTLKYNKTSGQERFRYYTNGQQDICLYREMTASDYAKSFLTGGAMSSSKSGCSNSITNWTSLGNEFKTLSDTVKATLSSAEHDEPEAYDSSTALSVAECVARYDHAIRTHTELRTNEFMERFGEGKVNPSYSSNTIQESVESHSFVVVIISFSIAGASVGLYFLLRKRKENY